MNKPSRTRTFSRIGTTLAIAAFGFAIPLLMPAPAKSFVAFSFGFPIGFPAYPPPPPYYLLLSAAPAARLLSAARHVRTAGRLSTCGCSAPRLFSFSGFARFSIDHLYAAAGVDRRLRPAMSRIHDHPGDRRAHNQGLWDSCRDPDGQWRIVN